MNKKNPLLKLIAHPEYSRGYQNGKAFGKFRKKVKKLKIKKAKNKKNGVAIKSGNIIMNVRFDTIEEAELFICEKLLGKKKKREDVNLSIINP